MRIEMDDNSRKIDVVNLENASNIRLNLRTDQHDEHLQPVKFYFEGRLGLEYFFHINNASKAIFSKGAQFDSLYQAQASYDGQDWFLVPTAYDPHSGNLTIHLQKLKQERIKFVCDWMSDTCQYDETAGWIENSFVAAKMHSLSGENRE